jgi:hypothetical protein
LQFLLQAASPEAFGYALEHRYEKMVKLRVVPKVVLPYFKVLQGHSPRDTEENQDI